MQGMKCVVHRLVTLAAGAAAGKFLQYQEGAPTMGVQTAYGIEANVSGYSQAFDGSSMLFMDFRRHHTGVWPSAAEQCAPSGALLLIVLFGGECNRSAKAAYPTQWNILCTFQLCCNQQAALACIAACHPMQACSIRKKRLPPLLPPALVIHSSSSRPLATSGLAGAGSAGALHCAAYSHPHDPLPALTQQASTPCLHMQATARGTPCRRQGPMGHQPRGALLPVRHALARRACVPGGDLPGGQACAAFCYPQAPPSPAPSCYECEGASLSCPECAG